MVMRGKINVMAVIPTTISIYFFAFFHINLCMMEGGSSISSPKPRYPPVRLHSSITRKTTILNLNILHFMCIVSLLQNN
jgi:hypothetical protein